MTAEQPDEVRVVLLKPGDILAIGNLGDWTEDAPDPEQVARLKEDIGLRAVWLFAADITLDVVHDKGGAAP